MWNILKFSCETLAVEMVMESALLTMFNSSRFEVLFIFKGKQGIFLQFV